MNECNFKYTEIEKFIHVDKLYHYYLLHNLMLI